MFRFLRNIEFFNKIIRTILKTNIKLFSKLKKKWRVVGKVKIKFNDTTAYFYSKADDGIIDALYYGWHYMEIGELKLFTQIAKQSNTILDIGANTGVYSILTAKSNPKAKIIAFEPNPINLVRLKKNIGLNNLTNVTIIPNAIGDEVKRVNLTIPVGDTISDTSSVLPEFSRLTYINEVEWKEIEVQQDSLDNLMNTFQTKIDLIKIDVEGYEMSVFEGGKNFFKVNSPIILCEIFLNDQNKKYFEAFLTEYDYTAYMVVKDELIRLDKILIYNADGLNYLFAKGITKQVKNPLSNANSLINELKGVN